MNEQLHRERAGYGAGGWLRADLVRDAIIHYASADVLDYGCGKASLSKKIKCRNYDPCVPKYAAEPSPADIVACFDVLEHIEPECLADVLAHLRSLTRKVLIAAIATHPDRSKNLPDGTNPHRIVKPAEWWVETLGGAFNVVESVEAAKEVTIWAIP